MENINKQLETQSFWVRLKEKILNDFFSLSAKSKLRIKKFSKIFLIFVLYVLAILGMVFGTLNLAKRSDKKGLFGSTYSITYVLDTDPNNYNLALEQTQDSAKAFSNWLLYSSISNNGVYYEVTKENDINNPSSGSQRYYGIVYVEYINVDQIYFDDLKEDVDVDPIMVASEHMHNSSIEVWEYNREPGSTNDISTYIGKEPILTTKNFDYNSAKIDERNKTSSDGKPLNNFGVELNLTGTYNLSNGKKFEEQASAEDYTVENNGQTEWVVFQDLDSLINKLNLSKFVSLMYDKTSTNSSGYPLEEQEKWKLNYQTLSNKNPDLIAWSDKAIKTISGQYDESVITKDKIFEYYKIASLADDDPLKPTTIPSAINAEFKTIVDKYILGTITKDNYKQWFPSNTSTIDFTNVNKFSIQKANANESTQRDLIFQFQNLVMPVEFLQQNKNVTIGNSNEFVLNGTGWIGEPFVQQGITKLSSYSAILLTSSVILLTIAIIISIFYRVPGLMGAFTIITSTLFTSGLMVLLKINFSITTVIGLSIGVILAMVCVSFSMERIRRLIIQKNSIFDSIQTAIRKSMMTTVDLNITTIIMGLSLFFVSKGDVPDLGLILVLSPMVIVGCMFIFFYFPLYIYSGYRKVWKVGLTITPLSTESKVKIWFDNKKWWFIWLILFVFVLLMIIVVSALGIDKSSFGEGTIVIIKNVSQTQYDKLLARFDSSWSQASLVGTTFTIKSSRNFTADEVKAIISPIVGSSSMQLDVFSTSPTIQSKIFTNSFYGLITGFAAISLYYIIRSNVLSVIPLFILNIFVSSVCASMSYAIQLPISNFFIYGLITAGVLSNISACLYVSIIRTRFNRKHIFEIEKIKLFIVNNIKSNLNTFFIITSLSFFMYLMFAIVVSPTTIFIFLNLALLSVASMYMSLFLTAHVYYYVIVIRQLYVNRVLNNLDTKLNNKFVEVDEQLIYSINKFH